MAKVWRGHRKLPATGGCDADAAPGAKPASQEGTSPGTDAKAAFSQDTVCTVIPDTRSGL